MTRHDYDALELEYIQGPDELTPRKMAERDGASYSAYYEQYRKREWERKRSEYRNDLQRRMLDEIVDATAVKVGQIKKDALEVIHAAVLKMGLDLQDRKLADGTVIPGQIVTANDLSKLLDRLLVLTGNPNQINENRQLSYDLTGIPPDVARVLAEVAAERGSPAGGVGRAALPGARPARTN